MKGSYSFKFQNKTRKCFVCGNKYEANSAGQKYCSKCAPIAIKKNRERLQRIYKKRREVKNDK